MKPNTPSCMIEITQHALKGQKLLAQGIALGMRSVSNAPCKGKSFKIHIIKMVNQLRYVKLLPLQVGCSKFESKIRHKKWCYFGAVKLLIFNTLTYEIVLWKFA